VANLETAVEAYRRAEDAVARAQVDAQALVEAARQQRTQARERLAEAIVAAARGGARQVDLVKITGYTRETIRRILRAGGIEAD